MTKGYVAPQSSESGEIPHYTFSRVKESSTAPFHHPLGDEPSFTKTLSVSQNREFKTRRFSQPQGHLPQSSYDIITGN